VRDLLARQPGARRLLQTLPVGRPGFSPFEENGVRGYRFEGQATYGGLLAGLSVATSDGIPEGSCSLYSGVPRRSGRLSRGEPLSGCRRS
jgi:hypothetical protein